jgi:phosphatidylglycerol:prolipoprotein diacylglycerol transferase
MAMTEIATRWSQLFEYVPGSLTYVLFWAAAALTWFVGTLALAARDGLPRGRVAILLLLSVPLFVIGARAHALLFEARVPLGDLVREPSLLFEPGWRLPGGLLLGVSLSPVLAALLRIPFRPFADAAVPFAGLGLAVGRLGCFLNGCCHGRVSDLPWAVRFPRDSEAWANHVGRGLLPSHAELSLPVQPLQLYLVLAGVVATAILLWLRPRRRFTGEVALVGGVLITWPAAALELLRESEFMQPVALRSAIPLTVGALCLAAWLRARLRPTPAVVPGALAARVASERP